MSWKGRGVPLENRVSVWCKWESTQKRWKEERQGSGWLSEVIWFSTKSWILKMSRQNIKKRGKRPHRERTADVWIQKVMLRIFHPSRAASDLYQQHMLAFGDLIYQPVLVLMRLSPVFIPEHETWFQPRPFPAQLSSAAAPRPLLLPGQGQTSECRQHPLHTANPA